MFKYSLLDRIELKDTTTNVGRVYHTPIGDLRSVTTILGSKLKSTKLTEWRNRIGHSKADGISEQARTRGNAVHKMCEQYLLGNQEPMKSMMPSNLEMFLRVKPILDTSVTCIYGVEFPLHSLKLQTAGRADGIVEWRNKNAVLDFKTVRKVLAKDDDRITKYQLQVTVYAMMAEEMYGIALPYNIIVMIPADGDYPELFIRSNLKIRPFVEKIFEASNH